MVRLREIPRTAAFAWSPGSHTPLIVTGTRAGAVDADFSDETKLELWDLSLDNPEQGVELQPVVSVSTDSRFHDIAWGPPDADHPGGIIAGALENGSLDLWDAIKLMKGDKDAFMSRTTKHSEAIKSLQFNPLKPLILATAGAKGELFIYDVNDISNPFRMGTAVARSDDLECVAWNRKVPHILATGGSAGFVTVWDLKTKKASLTLNNSRKAVGAIAWDPNNATKLLTATPDDSSPVILLWDLRNSNAPEQSLQGHDQGILSLSWCQQDSDLLLSCGKDNRTLVWNPQTGERLGEFPEVTNWTFQTKFHPHNPAVSATASLDGKISVQTLQNTNTLLSQAPVQGSADGEDFFTKAQTQPQGASFSLQKAPKWLERPIGASFAFGGKLVSFDLVANPLGQPRLSKIQITTFSVDSDVAPATEFFEKALVTGNLSKICEIHISQAKSDDEKGDWKIIETLIAENTRKMVTEYLGFPAANASNNLSETNRDEKETADTATTENSGTPTPNINRLSTLFADGADGDDFLSSIAATKGAKSDNPFRLFSDQDSASGWQITKALMLGQFEDAMTLCTKEGRIADALIIANCGGKDLFDKAQSAYLAQKAQEASYLRLLSSIIGKNLWDIVYNADLENWKEAMATVCTYADPSEFSDLCEALGDRISEAGAHRDACFCYLVGSKLEKAVTIWISELEQNEKTGVEDQNGGSSFSVHARSLQSFIEKVTIFREAIKFQDKEKALQSDWKLAPLYDKYTEYADIVAAHGQLSIAERYLDLLPTEYPAAEVARNRVKLASRKAVPKAIQQAAEATRVQASTGYQSLQQPIMSPAQTPANQYAAAATPAANPYAPLNTAYAPQQGYQQSLGQAQYAPGYSAGYANLNSGNGAPIPSFGPPPPSTSNLAPLAPPPSRAKESSSWNDTPMVTKAPLAKRSGQVAGTMTNQYSNQQNLSMPPPVPPYGGARASPPPPPKGLAPLRMSSPLTGPGQSQLLQQVAHPTSTTNPYAPPPKASPGQQYGQPGAPPTIKRGASPYDPPPTSAPPSNRYAPSPSQQQQFSQPPSQQTLSAPPPPQPGMQLSHNPYAPPPSNAPQNPYAATQQAPYLAAQRPPIQMQNHGSPLFQGPPQGSRPPSGGPSSKTPGPSDAQPKSKHPSGDRSHIPSNAQRLVEVFNADMQRVAAKAPSSFAAQVKDTQKRLNILFDHLNNEELLTPHTIATLGELAKALQSQDYDVASRMQVEIQREKTDECGNWMVGVKRLIAMSKATP